MIWKSIIGWPYEVSDLGEVRRLGQLQSLKPMKFGAKRKQYSVVSLCQNGTQIRRRVHHLVLEAFVGPRPPRMWALHRDDDASNNTLPNLYWGTPNENAWDMVRNYGTLTADQVTEIKKRRTAGERGRTLASEFGISEQLICDIHKGRCYHWGSK